MNRRGALRALGALPGAVAAPAFGAADEASIVTAPIRAFYDALLDVMRRAKALGVRGRYDALAPVIRATFDLAAMTRISVGPRWNTIPPEQQAALIDGFTRMTIATYASRFDGYSGERFEVDPAIETRKTGSVVHTRLVQSNGEPIAINYLMRHSAPGWKVVDVYLTGTISELATRRSEFSAILDAGGATKLIDTLKQQTDQLLQPTPAK
ncbi:MAG TPA: ABC transporter substrate-binding protein [Casimicrobiaceae bacterium]|nr:ABC transporter substrate-binding protein [Casimicrobiaceae bacterium]